MKRYLTQLEADRCENAREPVCKCRCGGFKHGAKRVPSGGDFSALPMDDPHYRPVLTKKESRQYLARVQTYLIWNASDFFRVNSDQAWRDALAIIQKAKLEL